MIVDAICLMQTEQTGIRQGMYRQVPSFHTVHVVK